MENKLSTAKLEYQIYELSKTLSSSEWNDEVKNSYFRFIDEERTLASNMKWLADRANDIYNYVTDVDPAKFKATYNECLSKFQRLQRGD